MDKSLHTVKQPLVSFSVSDIVERIKTGNSFFNLSTMNKNIIIIWWPASTNDITRGWFNIRLFMDTRSGFLTDTHAPFNFKRDIPIDALYDAVTEMLVIAKLSDDPCLNSDFTFATRVIFITKTDGGNQGYTIDRHAINTTYFEKFLDTLYNSSVYTADIRF